MLSDDQRWMASSDIEMLGFTRALLSARRVREVFCKEPKNEAEFRVGFGFRRDRGVFRRGLRERSPEGHARPRGGDDSGLLRGRKRSCPRERREQGPLVLCRRCPCFQQQQRYDDYERSDASRYEEIVFGSGNDQLENLCHRSGALGRSGLRTRPLHLHDSGKRREEQNTNGELPVGVAKAARRRLENRGRYGHRGSAARATSTAFAIYELIHASKLGVRTRLCERRRI